MDSGSGITFGRVNPSGFQNSENKQSDGISGPVSWAAAVQIVRAAMFREMSANQRTIVSPSPYTQTDTNSRGNAINTRPPASRCVMARW